METPRLELYPVRSDGVPDATNISESIADRYLIADYVNPIITAVNALTDRVARCEAQPVDATLPPVEIAMTAEQIVALGAVVPGQLVFFTGATGTEAVTVPAVRVV